ncbi:sirohydrochlorin chelatase [Actinocrinis puniceicyclus]|uniref:Sirohydrochlorin chelatase n=1 Tax=Actinocrinis puniceicyclus TaxID=977794 RepID=A0A8J7WJK1_9ACTN|nr:sirohydrochlorin chelatase [Actinocrinis puniceicyclus]MBS2962508.1 sirohydrochlorin chelatase [Actinocrinis puniceicyclus]
MSAPVLGPTAFREQRPGWLLAPPGVLPPPRSDVPLLAVAHGTADPAGLAALDALLERVRFLRPGVLTALSFVSVARPRVDEELARLLAQGVTELVVVPLLLGSGYHVRHDLPRALRQASGLPGGRAARIYQAPALGPDPMLAAVMQERLSAAHGTVFGTQVVLAAAGSADRRANADAVAMAGLLAERLGMPVRTGYVTTAEPSVSALLTRLARRGRPVAVATYLLSPGEFSRRIDDSATLAALAALDVDRERRRRICVSEPLGAHDQVARLVLRRYDAALAGPPARIGGPASEG